MTAALQLRKSEVAIVPSQPRKLSDSLSDIVEGGVPLTLLAEVQTAWAQVCGPSIAAAAEPVGERRGVVTIACESGVWAQELELMGEVLRARLEVAVGENRIERLRFTADLSRHR